MPEIVTASEQYSINETHSCYYCTIFDWQISALGL